MSRYYRRRRRNNSNGEIIELLFKGMIYIIALPIFLIIWIIKLSNKNNNHNKNNNINKSENIIYNEKGNMNKKEIIDNLDINKLKNERKKFSTPYNIIATICIISALIGFYGIGNGITTLFLIMLAIFSITIITCNIIKKRMDEIDYYIDIIEDNEAEENYNKYIRSKYSKDKTKKQNNTSKYHIKSKTITDNEKYFLDIIKKQFNNEYDIRVQVPLASVIEKDKDFPTQYQNELNRIIDIGIFDKESSYPLLLIEINDPTHYRKDRQIRDAKLNKLCEEANIKLIEFWTENNNSEEYIIEQINKNLGR